VTGHPCPPPRGWTPDEALERVHIDELRDRLFSRQWKLVGFRFVRNEGLEAETHTVADPLWASVATFDRATRWVPPALNCRGRVSFQVMLPPRRTQRVNPQRRRKPATRAGRAAESPLSLLTQFVPLPLRSILKVRHGRPIARLLNVLQS
jgi:hypothetical protein